MAERITHSEFNDKIINSPILSVVDFYSDTCVPCKRMSPILTALENSYQDELFVAKVNIAYERELVEEYQIKTTPTFLFFKDGKVVERFSGVRKKEEIALIIETNK